MSQESQTWDLGMLSRDFPSYHSGCTSRVLPLDLLCHWEAGDAEAPVPALSIDSVGAWF